MKRPAMTSLPIVLAIACLATPLPAQDPPAAEPAGEPTLLWMSYVTAEPGRSDDLARHLAEVSEELYAGLIADGQVTSRGVAQAVNHFPGDDWSHLEFVNFRDWAAVGEFAERFAAAQLAKSPEALAAEAATWQELTVDGSHYDLIARHTVLESTSGRPSYIWLSLHTLQPGAGPRVAPLYERARRPLMDPLLASGDVVAHGAVVRELHGDGGWDAAGWYAMTHLGVIDQVTQADEAFRASLAGDELAALGSEVGRVFDQSGPHSDRILVVLHYQDGTR